MSMKHYFYIVYEVRFFLSIRPPVHCDHIITITLVVVLDRFHNTVSPDLVAIFVFFVSADSSIMHLSSGYPAYTKMFREQKWEYSWYDFMESFLNIL